MTETTVPDAAVQIAVDGLARCATVHVDTNARAVVAALSGAGWLHDPAEVAALRDERDAEIAAGVARDEDLDHVTAELEAARARIAALQQVADAARSLLNADDPYGEVREGATQMDDLLAAVTALDTATMWTALVATAAQAGND